MMTIQVVPHPCASVGVPPSGGPGAPEPTRVGTPTGALNPWSHRLKLTCWRSALAFSTAMGFATLANAQTPVADAAATAAFQAACAAKAEAADKAGAMAVPGKDGWLFLGKELRHLSVGTFWGEAAAKVSHADKPEWTDPLPVILDFKAQLDKAGIQLILVPVPPKAIIYPDKLDDGVKAPVAARLDPAHQEFYKLLRDKGVTVLDLTDDFLKARQGARDEDRLFCMTDTHWSPVACELAAKRITETIGNKLDQPQLAKPPSAFKGEAQTLEITGDMEKALHGDAGAKEKLPAHLVTPSGADAKVTDTVDKASPVLLIGDSHGLVFHAGEDMLAKGMGLVDQLALDLNMPVDLLGVRGSGATPSRMNLLQRTRGNPQYLAGKKVVVWCFTAREFTESQGWRKVPVVKMP